MKPVLIIFLFIGLLQGSPVPQGEDEGNVGSSLQPPPPGSQPPSFFNTLAKDNSPAKSDSGEIPQEKVDSPIPNAGIAPVPLPTPTSSLSDTDLTQPPKEELVEPPASTAVGPAVTIGAINNKEETCGPACMLVNQTPIIILVLIIVLVILLLIILFGCYFLKKLHGKAIFTTGHRHLNMVGGGSDRGAVVGKNVGGNVVARETKPFEPVLPGESETKRVVTTTTTKIVQASSSSSRDNTLFNVPLTTNA